MKTIINTKTAIILAYFSFSSLSVFAGLDDIGGDVDVPIDGGLSLLVAAGVGYGVRNLRKKKPKKLHLKSNVLGL